MTSDAQTPQSQVEESSVKVVPYDPRWPELYQREAHQLQVVLGDFIVAIEHFGSTAVPGLDAKPNLDILIGTAAGMRPTDEQLASLAQLNYEYLGEDGRRPGRWFFRKRGTDCFNLSIVQFGSELWWDNIHIRDYLRTHPDEAARYSVVKDLAAAAEPYSLLGYQNRKRAFVEELRERARIWAQSRE